MKPNCAATKLALAGILACVWFLPVQAQEPVATPQPTKKDAAKIPPPAWQSGDPKLAAKWEQLTGRFIYQQTCVSCHKWGPNYWPKGEWETYLQGFPDNHEPDVRKDYADLSAMLTAGKLMPSKQQHHDALLAYVLAAAPAKELPEASRDQDFRYVPEVGQPAPDFAIEDINGNPVRLAQFKGRKPLVLVFSRAHW